MVSPRLAEATAWPGDAEIDQTEVGIVAPGIPDVPTATELQRKITPRVTASSPGRAIV